VPAPFDFPRPRGGLRLHKASEPIYCSSPSADERLSSSIKRTAVTGMLTWKTLVAAKTVTIRG
jgi:hypothetical protein